MGLLEIVLLAIVQGVTEFLPVSSSGHLVVINELMVALGSTPPEDLLEVNIALHVGTLASVLVFYRREAVDLLLRDRRAMWVVLVGTIPAATIGLTIDQLYGDVLESPLVAGCMFPVTALLLWWGGRQAQGATHYNQLTYGRALAVGCLQAFALLPGISRSGSTIAGGLAVGLDRKSAGTFAFLLAIPAIGGAGLVQVAKMIKTLLQDDPAAAATPLGLLLLGGVISFSVGLVALWQLVRLLERGRLAWFGWYLVPLGVAVVVWQLWPYLVGVGEVAA